MPRVAVFGTIAVMCALCLWWISPTQEGSAGGAVPVGGAAPGGWPGAAPIVLVPEPPSRERSALAQRALSPRAARPQAIDAGVNGPAPAPQGTSLGADIPSFPEGLSKAEVVAAIAERPQPCGGSGAAAAADSIDDAVQGANPRGLQALLHLVLSDSELGVGDVTDIVRSLDRYPGGAAALSTVISHAHAIAARQYRTKQREFEASRERYRLAMGGLVEDLELPPQEQAIASLERDVLVAVIDAAQLGRSHGAQALVHKLMSSDVLDTAEVAAGAAADLGGGP